MKTQKNCNKQAQSTLEYTVILSILLLILSAVVYLLVSGSADSSRVVANAQSSGKLLTLGLSDFLIDPTGTSLLIRNNAQQDLILTNVTVSGTPLSSRQLPYYLTVGDQVRFRSYDIYATTESTYAHEVVIHYKSQDGQSSSVTQRFFDDTKLLDDDLYQIQPTEPLAEGLVALYRFNDSSDTSGNGRAIINNTGNLVSSGIVNKALLLASGEQAIVSHDTTLNRNDAFTVAFWIKKTSAGTDQWTVGKRTSWAVTSTLNGNISLVIYANAVGTTVATTSFGGNDWKHVAIRYFENATNYNATIFINGSLVASNIGSAIGDFSQSTNFTFGNITNGHVGYLDEVGLWNRLLDDNEIVSIARRGNMTLS